MRSTPSTSSSPSQNTGRDIETSFGRIGYDDHGVGPIALFVHGVLMNRSLWASTIDALGDAGRFVVPDLLGHGDTVGAADEDLSFGSQAGMIVELIETLDLGSVDLLGNDSGGAIAQIVAARRPDLVRSLALTNCDTHDHVLPDALVPFVDLCTSGRVLGYFETLLGRPERARQLIGVGLRQPEMLADETLRAIVEPLVRNERREHSIERWMTALTATDLLAAEATLARSGPPTLIVWGTDDVFFPLDHALRLANLLPDCDGVVEVPGARLFFPLEDPGPLIDPLLCHWERVRR